MTEDRRRTVRVRAYRPVQLHRLSHFGIVETLTKDLGIDGLRVLSPTLFPVSTELEVEFGLSSGEEPIRAKARAVWFKTLPESEQFDIGIIFSEISPQNKRRLSMYLDRLSRQTASVLASQ